ncbi:hypothetical protein ACFWWM_17670 [Streptomyces sp. NPDC058682]|uniref:hypothetical protein n=1 Tax=Streptomyces sp. NPDC058682 TaxID=3346596 RepID=UPI00365B575B
MTTGLRGFAPSLPVPRPADVDATGRIDDVVLLLGVADASASKRFYVDHGLQGGAVRAPRPGQLIKKAVG